ncbi:MAG: hypothetical protein ACOY3V_03345 [Pseudomonadota bacterium]
MDVAATSFALEYTGIRYAFCSMQCNAKNGSSRIRICISAFPDTKHPRSRGCR